MNPTQNKYTNKQALTDAQRIIEQAKAQSASISTVQAQGNTVTASVAPPTPSPAPGYGNYGAKAATAPRTITGQHITKSGNLSTLYKGMGLKRRMKIEKAARLCATGLYADKDIAKHLGMTPVYLTQLKTTKEFHAASIAVMSGVLSQENDAALASVEARREELEDMVPVALLRLRNMVLSRNENIAMKAVTEILDRDGNLAKVSKSTVELKKTEDMSAASATATSILDILRGAGVQVAPSDNGGISPDFTVNAATAKVQIEDMSEKINEKTLDTIDMSTRTVQ